jgi:hypothetical protein
MNTNALQGTMINGDKDTGLALFGGPAGGHVRSPHLVTSQKVRVGGKKGLDKIGGVWYEQDG